MSINTQSIPDKCGQVYAYPQSIVVNRIPGTWSIFMCQAGESLVSTRYDQVTWSIPGVDYSLNHPGVEPQASNMTAVAPAIGETGLLAGGVRRGGVKGMKPVGYEVRLQGGVKSVFVDCCGMCGKVGSRNRELRECRWTSPAGCIRNSLITWQALRKTSTQ